MITVLALGDDPLQDYADKVPCLSNDTLAVFNVQQKGITTCSVLLNHCFTRGSQDRARNHFAWVVWDTHE